MQILCFISGHISQLIFKFLDIKNKSFILCNNKYYARFHISNTMCISSCMFSCCTVSCVCVCDGRPLASVRATEVTEQQELAEWLSQPPDSIIARSRNMYNWKNTVFKN